MQQLKLFSTLIIIFSLSFFSCSDNKKNDSESLIKKKKELAQLIAQKNKLEESINALQNEISKSETGKEDFSKSKLIAVSEVPVQKFEHFIDLRGKIDAENISYITPRGMGGQVKSIFVREGDVVKKGQRL